VWESPDLVEPDPGEMVLQVMPDCGGLHARPGCSTPRRPYSGSRSKKDFKARLVQRREKKTVGIFSHENSGLD